MKKTVNVVLVEGTDEDAFIASFETNENVELKNSILSIPTLLTMRVEEDYIDTFKEDERISAVEKNDFIPVPYGLTYETQTGTVVTERTDIFSASNNGTSYMPLQLYDDVDIQPQTTIVGNDPDDDANQLADVDYYSAFFGKNVDFVALEVGPVTSSYNNYQTDPHPDFTDPDNPTNSRFIPTDWPDLEAPANKQATNGNYFTSHGIGVLSAAAGRYCGFAKKANMYMVSLEGDDSDPIECINAIISWHNSKSNNPETGVPNPTILNNSWGYNTTHYWLVEVDDIDSIETPAGTVNRPGSSWGTDLSPFVDANMLPVRLKRSDNTWIWAISFHYAPTYTALKTAMDAAWDAGITVVNSAGNAGSVYAKSDDAEFNNLCRTSANPLTYYTRTINSFSQVTAVTNNTTTLGNLTWYTHRLYGPAGSTRNKAIDVAAGQNSQKYPILDNYSTRGKGIDIIAKGSDSYNAYPVYTMADGKWGYFGGTSCAAPNVSGKAACEMEKYFYYNGSWPTNSQVKEILLNQAKAEVYGVESTDWSAVGSADTGFTTTEDEDGDTLAKIEVGTAINGGIGYSDLIDTTTLTSFFNAQGFNRSNTTGYRPTSGGVYPRPRIKR